MFTLDSICPLCDTTKLIRKIAGEPFRFPIEKDAFLTIIIPDVESWQCPTCGEGFFQHGAEGLDKITTGMKKAKEDWKKEKENLGL
jgi:hypothetical protein